MIRIRLALFILAALGGAVAHGDDLRDAVAGDYAYLEEIYRHFHQNPELSLGEVETSERIAEELERLGFDVTRHVGGYGIAAVLRNGAGSTVMVRTDMDALPVEEKTGLPYASRVVSRDHLGNTVPVMHACGHDVHMTVFLGTARRLAAARKQWRGTLLMIAQPAEELGSGAKAMLDDGLFERFPRPAFNLALHTAADLPAGDVAYSPGWAYANVDSVDIRVKGIGGHGSRPETAKDPIVLAAYIVTALQTLVAREIAPQEPAVVTVGAIHGGTKHNIIPDLVQLKLTVRSYGDETREKLLHGIERIARAQAQSAGLPEALWPEVEYGREYTPAAYNDPQLSERLAGVLTARLGAEHVHARDPVMAGEDFGRYARVEPPIPSLQFWLGGVDPEVFAAAQRSGAQLPSLHSAYFAPLAEPTIKTGVEAMTAAVLALLR